MNNVVALHRSSWGDSDVTAEEWSVSDKAVAEPYVVPEDGAAQKQTRAPGRKNPMSDDPISREELQAELRAVRSDSDAKFERIIGEVRLANADVTAAISNIRTELAGDYNTFKAEMKGDNEVTRARMAGKLTVWAAVASAVVAIIGTLVVLVQIAQTGYDSGVVRQTASQEYGAKLNARMDALAKEQAAIRDEVRKKQSDGRQ